MQKSTQDTIIAIATASGVGGIAIVRISGGQALEIARNISAPAKNNNNRKNTNRKNNPPKNTLTNNTNSANTKKTAIDFAQQSQLELAFTPRYATLCNIYDIDKILLDEAIIIYYKAPHSYTREDVIEVQCHANDIITNKILQTCLHYGARLARGGEFTKRAFLNGRIDLSQVNAISQMIATKDSYLQSALISQLKGSLGDFVCEVREVLLFALASAEVMIDYSEEDIPSDIISAIESKLESLRIRLKNIYDFSATRAKIGNVWKLAIIGKPNVGKSSLLNAILLQERAITSNIAGTTRDRIEEEILIDGSIVRLIDTAGIRASDDALESKGVELSLKALQEANIILAVFDSSRTFDSEDKEVLALLECHKQDKKILGIFNKNDCQNAIKNNDYNRVESLCDEVIFLSALDIERTASILQKKLKNIIDNSNLKGEIILSAPYQLESIKSSMSHLELATQRLKSSELELFAYHIKDTLESIGQITSPYATDEMLDKMFSEFCLGK